MALLSGEVEDDASSIEDNTLTPAGGSVKGGLSWTYNDDTGALIQRGLIQPSLELRVPRVTPVAHSFSVAVPNKVTTKLCSAGINGGIIIAPNQSLYSSVRVKLYLSYYIQFVNAWASPGRIELFLEEGETTIQKRTIKQEVVEGLGGLLPGALFSFVDISASADFQDPELAEQTGLLASAFDAPEVQQRIKLSTQQIEQPFREQSPRTGNGKLRNRKLRARERLALSRRT